MTGTFEVPNSLVDDYLAQIKPTAFAVYCVLKHLSKGDGTKVNQIALARRLRITRERFYRSLFILQQPDIALIAVDRRNTEGRMLCYTILPGKANGSEPGGAK